MIYREKNPNVKMIPNTFGISDTLLKILIKRGYDTDAKINEFLHPSFDFLINPYLFNHMQVVVDKIRECINSKKQIVIYGDYDVDGTMSVSALYLALRGLGANVVYYIPDRHKEGYGLNKDAISLIQSKFPNCLVITVDCGITSVEEVAYAKQIGLDIIVTDHHNPKEALPDCPIIDAKVGGENYPFKELCGAGVVGKIIHALAGSDYMKKFIDLIAIATIADVVPLVGENRVLVYKGLEFINYIKRPGFAGLSKYVKDNGKIVSSDIAFGYGPMMNACGRLGNATDVVKLMTTNDSALIEDISAKLNDYNTRRKDKENFILNECRDMLGEGNRKSIVLWNKEWDSGVIGIVASRLVEEYHCPAILLSYDAEKDVYSGSGRSIENINLFDLLTKCEQHLVSFGGHNVAAGLRVSPDKLNDFSLAVAKECNKFDDSVFEEIVEYDETIKVFSLNKRTYEELKMVQPCGAGNPEIKFYLKNVSLKNLITVGKKHNSFSAVVFDETGNCDAICFNKQIPDYLDDIDMIGYATLNTYKGKSKIVCQISSFKKSDTLLQRELASQFTQYGIRVIDQPIEVLGLSDKKQDQFKKAGLDTIQKLINYFPKKYLDFRFPKKASEISYVQEMCSMIGTIVKLKQGPKMAYAMCKDEDDNLFMACWFHQDYVLRMLNSGYKYIFCGNAKRSDMGFVQIYPLYFGSDIKKYQTIIPEYKKIKSMSSEYLISSIDKALQLTANTDFLDKSIVDQFNLISDYDATKKLHHPSNDFEIRDGQRRKVFNDLFKFNFILKSRQKDNENSEFILRNRDRWQDLRNILPYQLTNDQDKCLEGLYEYINSGRILNALVQGDVGSGKTMIGLFSMLLAANNGYQSCIIAPTEVLAKQHYEEISGYMEQLGYKVGYLVGGLKVKERKAVLAGLKDGSIDMVVGTHAVIQDTVEFNNLAVVVIDEQHRFGVSQREKLAKIEGPHMISMSATPIPRTLSMAIYGDNIQVYSIREKPAGRKDIVTIRMNSDEEINQFMLEQIRQGRQCYVVCPLIEDSESATMTDVHSVKKEVENLFDYFAQYPEVKISNTTGRMKKELIEENISKFVNKETNILVSTTIIEVGVNVPNATVMVLKSSERFGLAQAHQLRGRVGRGVHQSYCLLQTDKDDPKAEILCDTNDGFEIAKQDLLLRGAGDYIGTQQTGNNKNVMLMMSEPDLYKEISNLNETIYQNPAMFAKYEYIIADNEREADLN